MNDYDDYRNALELISRLIDEYALKGDEELSRAALKIKKDLIDHVIGWDTKIDLRFG